MVPIDLMISKLVNGTGASYGFSNVAIIFVGFAFAVIPKMVTQLFQRFAKTEEKVAEMFEKDLTVVFSLIWIFYLLIYSVGEFTNFVHIINGVVGFIIRFSIKE